MNDLINRQKAIDALAEMHCKSDEDGYVWIIRSDAWARIDALPSAEPEVLACGSGVLEAQPEGGTQMSSADCISRREAIDALEWKWAGKAALDAIKALPSAQQWIPCSEGLPKKDGRYWISTKTIVCEDNFENGEFIFTVQMLLHGCHCQNRIERRQNDTRRKNQNVDTAQRPNQL